MVREPMGSGFGALPGASMTIVSIRRVSRACAALLVALATWAPTRALAQDPGEMVVRITRLENQLREMAGQIEQLQHENRRLVDQLRKFQEDVEFRFGDKGARAQAPSGSPGSSQGRGQGAA